MEATTRERTWAVARGLLSAACIVGGFGSIVIAVVFGRCSAFGDSCPAEAPPLWDDDTRRFAAIGAAAGAALVVGLIARSISYG